IGLAAYTVDVAKTSAIWAVGLALIVGIIAAISFDFRRVYTGFKDGVNASIGGSLLAVMNTASEYGFGAIIAALPGFAIISHALGNTF
ncbi:GntP family permease, partial [Mediterraneibacter sp. 210702-DFI.5.30]|nr:GntP family permease [Mediterraneibacter sp. 210702-DFI.5.30]